MHLSANIIGNQASKPARIIAFYLPQYLPIPEMDERVGCDFTESHNFTKPNQFPQEI